jgi:hypothetical protein
VTTERAPHEEGACVDDGFMPFGDVLSKRLAIALDRAIIDGEPVPGLAADRDVTVLVELPGGPDEH